MIDKMERQLLLESEMTSEGAERYFRAVTTSQQEDRGTEAAAGQRLLSAAVEPMAKAVEAFIAASSKGKPGRAAVSSKLLEGLDPKVIGYIAARAILDRVIGHGNVMLQTAAITTAGLLEDEVRFATFEAVAKDSFDLTERRLKQTNHRRHRRRVMVYQMNKNGLVWEEWSDRTKLLLGTKLIEMFVETTGLAEIEAADRGRYRLRPTQATLDWLEKSNARHSLLCPVYLPCIVPPLPWTTPLSGGYHSRNVKRVSLIKTRSKGFLDELFNADLSEVYASINTLQNTAWRVNTKVLTVARQMWDAGLGLGKVLPTRNGVEVPTKPGWLQSHDKDKPLPVLTEAQKEEFKAWKRTAAEAYTAHARATSRRLQAARIITVAERFAPEEEIFFPYTLDFRGRIYSVPPFLNPQGNDLAKGLLTFANGKPIGDTTGPGWLAIHGANVYGYDKASLDERIAWVEEHRDVILECAADPLANAFWQDADSPWSFLAFCFEWAEYDRCGAGFVSSLPIALDGSCNGIQHFSAMLRDEVGGAAVNLVPGPTPADIYNKVATVAKEKLHEICLEPSTEGALAKAWLDFGIDRKTTKRSVMVLPYGGTYMSCKEYVQEAVEEKIAAGAVNPWAGDRDAFTAAIHFLAKQVWQSISVVVIGAKEVMAWLQGCARLATKTGLPINWRTPSGLWVQQDYRAATASRIDVKVFGERVRLTINTETSEIDASRQVAGIAPNFVHSLDAAALVLSVNTATANGMTSFAMIHDSYGTVAADTDMLGACLRHAFVNLYKENDVLARFRETILAMLTPGLAEKLPPLPARGNLDLDAVLSSDFFFA